ncbi:hypothetical protein NL676_012165, partial [Syzygium grande]
VKVGQEKEFEVTLQRLRGKSIDISQEAAEIRVISPLNVSEFSLFLLLLNISI